MPLNKLFLNIFIFGLSLNIVIFLFGVFGVDPQVKMPFMDLSTWSSWFPVSAWEWLLTGAAIAGITLAAVLLRQGTYAIYALLIAALGLILKPVREFILAIPNAIGAWLPDSTNPLPPVGGVYPPNPITVVIIAIFSFAAFWFIFGLVIQRDV